MTAAVRLTDAERVDVLLDETKRLRAIAAYKLQADGDDLAKLLAIRDAPILEQMAALRQELELSEATNAELRARVDVLQRDARETRELGRRGLELLAAACRERDEAIAARDLARRAANLPVDDGSSDTLALAAERSEHAQTREKLRSARETADREYSAARAELEQMRAASRTRPSAAFTLGQLIGVTIGAALVGGAAGVEVALRWLPW